ncbi:uncharacterized protein N7500_004107 [Penicillium coprophilum]|uniref:uncharacterized protein n=1 Tax=Penicillium coprophilum TaxID=36646 RepID=UPI00238E793D|nr:uncharacterized protein N7500_004107 [Penicillium coprophilum]KAJ5171324.1 hypothetical protein N7500_004107 [Penicillium coprophilum]
MWYYRHSVTDFACCMDHFVFVIWLDLPMYLLRTRKPKDALKAALWKGSNYLFIQLMWKYVNHHAAFCVSLLSPALSATGPDSR